MLSLSVEVLVILWADPFSRHLGKNGHLGPVCGQVVDLDLFCDLVKPDEQN